MTSAHTPVRADIATPKPESDEAAGGASLMAAPETGAPGTALETAAQAQEKEQSAVILTDLDAGRKHWLSLQARAALAGFQLHELASGELLVTRWGLARSLPDAYAVSRFLDQVTGADR